MHHNARTATSRTAREPILQTNRLVQTPLEPEDQMRLLPILCLFLAACAAPGQIPGDTPTEVASPSPDDATPGSTPSLVPASEQPTRVPADHGEALTGVLGADAIEGGCGYLQTPDGTRHEIIYPDGWQLRLSPLELRAPDGEVVATGGDEVTVHGSPATDMASICQIGPIFRAVEVDR